MRLLLCLLVLAGAAWPGERSESVAARKELSEAYFDELSADKRDRLFEALGSYDKPEVISPIAEIASRFGTYLAGLEGRMGQLQEKLRFYTERQALTEMEIGLRNSHLRKIAKLEKEWQRGLASQELLAAVLGSFRDHKTIQSILTIFPKHPTWRVRELLALACARWHTHLHDAKASKKAFDVLKRLARDKEPRVRIAVARSLGAFKRLEALGMLDIYMKDQDWRVRAAAVGSLGEARTSETIAILIKHLGKQKGRLVDDIVKALKKATGRNFQYAESWEGWWKQAGGKLPTPGEDPTANGGEAAPARKMFKPGHRFYGIPTRSERICYIIDVSGSMNKEVEPLRGPVTGKKDGETRAQGKTRIEVAKNELKRAVSNLNPKQRFTIIFFNQATMVWRRKMVPANPANKAAALKDIEAVVAKGATYTLGALREAFAVAGVMPGQTKSEEGGIDTIFLLSDGGPTDNKLHDPKPMDPDEILAAVRAWNKTARVVIHTIAVHTLEAGTYFLQSLAAQNDGIFVERQ
jgi:hypothetical protein